MRNHVERTPVRNLGKIYAVCARREEVARRPFRGEISGVEFIRIFILELLAAFGNKDVAPLQPGFPQRSLKSRATSPSRCFQLHPGIRFRGGVQILRGRQGSCPRCLRHRRRASLNPRSADRRKVLDSRTSEEYIGYQINVTAVRFFFFGKPSRRSAFHKVAECVPRCSPSRCSFSSAPVFPRGIDHFVFV